MSDTKINNLGLAEFVAGLISETFEALSSSMAEQFRRESEIRSAASLPLEQFRRDFIAESELTAEVDALCRRLYGSDAEVNPVRKGAVYSPPSGDSAEEPPILVLYGLQLKVKEHYKADGDSYVLTEEGADLIKGKIEEDWLAAQQKILREVLNRGFPRIIVDSGRILSKVSFQLSETGTVLPAPQAVKSTVPSRSALLSSRLGLNRANLLLPAVKFTIQPADDSDPNKMSSTSLYGEVEIHFKTVS